jgi:hypothetical protein
MGKKNFAPVRIIQVLYEYYLGCLLSSECSFIRMKQRCLKKNGSKYPGPSLWHLLYIMPCHWIIQRGDYVDRIYLIILEIKSQWGSNEIATLQQQRSFQFSIVNFPCIRSKPAYEVYISQLIIYSRDSVSNQNILDWWLLRTRKLQNQWFLVVNLQPEWRMYPYGMPNTGDQSSKWKFEFIFIYM